MYVYIYIYTHTIHTNIAYVVLELKHSPKLSVVEDGLAKAAAIMQKQGFVPSSAVCDGKTTMLNLTGA